MTLLLSNLVRITGGKRRAVQVWAECGALVAQPPTERAGTGTPRMFDDDEGIVACVIHQFSRQSVSIGPLIAIGKQVRALLALPNIHAQFEQAILGEGRHFLLVNKVDGTGKIVVVSDTATPNIDLFKMLAGVTTEKDDPVTHVINLNVALEGLRGSKKLRGKP